MSRFARPAAALLLGGALLATPALVATAAPDPSAPARPRVYGLVAHVYDLHASVADTAGTARVNASANRIAVTLNSNLLFAKDSAAIQPKAAARLAEISAQLKAAGPGAVQITGYTDDLGSAQHGIDLSSRRATAVRAALGKALADKTVTVTGKGEADPVVPNTDETSRARNRRVELSFTRK